MIWTWKSATPDPQSGLTFVKKIKKFDRPIYRTKFPRASGWIDENIHTDSTAVSIS